MIIKKFLNWLLDDTKSNFTGNEIGLFRIGITSALTGFLNLYIVIILIEKAELMIRDIKYFILISIIVLLIILITVLTLLTIFSLESFFDNPKNN